jgi:serine/threonine protein phosphatase PrpC
MTCRACGEPITGADAFCENCGADLPHTPAAPVGPSLGQVEESARTHLITLATHVSDQPAVPQPCPCASCGGEVGPDGWCTVCGNRASNGREHVSFQPAPLAAGVTDKGKIHPRNEDACALAGDGSWAVLVVCDGVSTATDSDVASLAAVNAARDVLVAAPRCPDADPGARIQHWSEQLVAAGNAADQAAIEAAHAIGDVDNPPSATFVAAVADGAVIVAAWIGDSRAYWLPDNGAAQQLSVDDSWATAQIELGMTREAAELTPQAHAITRWLGPDGPGGDASTSAMTATEPGWLMVCSDGLWNYCSPATSLGSLVASFALTDPLPLAEALVAWANDQGGHDNITVTLARINPSTGGVA